MIRSTAVAMSCSVAIEGEDLDCRIEAVVNPRVRGCRYTRNGDGWPDEPAFSEDKRVIEEATGRDVTSLVSEGEWERLDEALCETAARADEDAYEAAMEARGDEEREGGR